MFAHWWLYEVALELTSKADYQPINQSVQQLTTAHNYQEQYIFFDFLDFLTMSNPDMLWTMYIKTGWSGGGGEARP